MIHGVSFVVIARDEQFGIARCLASLVSCDLVDCQIVCVDSNSRDHTRSIMESYAQDHPGLFIVCDCRDHVVTNAAIARNAGLCHARKPIICFLDGDIEISPDFLRQAVALITSGAAGMVTGTLREHRFNDDYSKIVRVVESRQGMGGRKRIYHCGGNFILSAEIARRVGNWDERLIVNEDFDYTLKVSRLTPCIPLDIPMGTHLTKDAFFRSRPLKQLRQLYPMYFGYLLRKNVAVHPAGVYDLVRYSPIGTCGFIVIFLLAVSMLVVHGLKIPGYFALAAPLAFVLLDLPRCVRRGQSALSRLALNYAAAPLVLLGLVFNHPSFKGKSRSGSTHAGKCVEPGRRRLLIEPCDFQQFPKGGQLTMARHLLSAFGNRFALVGISTDDTPVGQWTRRVIDGVEYDYFAIYHRQISSRRPWIPARISVLLALFRYRRRINAEGCAALVQSQETLLALRRWRLGSLCYLFPGVENPLRISRYPWAGVLASLFDRYFFQALQNVDVILAAADQSAITELACRSRGRITPARITSFPTRVDRLIFRPRSVSQARHELGLQSDEVIWVTTGRIHWAKGWSFLLDALEAFQSGGGGVTRLVFVGDGEESPLLRASVAERGLTGRVIITGFVDAQTVAAYLQACDVFVLGSQKEGWCTALVEAMACGCRMVSTPVSSACEIISDGVNGRVASSYDPREFSELVRETLSFDLGSVQGYNAKASERYGLAHLKRDLCAVWPVLMEEL